MRELVINELMKCISNRNAEFWIEGLPMDDEGYVDYSKIQREHLENKPDEVLLKCFENCMCLKYR